MNAAVAPNLEDLAVWTAAKHERFVPFAFEVLKGADYIETPFDKIINDVLDKTFTGEIKRLIINIPPGCGKTLRTVWAYVARGFAINNQAHFIHASYSDQLVQDNSANVRDIVSSEEYKTLYPYVDFKADSNAKGLWKTSAGGSFLAKPAGGGITGFRAGVIGQEDRFSGALIIDDPLKPDDARYENKLQHINQRWENTFKSRLAHDDVPVIVIMQRIAEGDFTSELLDGSGANEDWHHLVLPAWIAPDYKYTQSGRYIEHNLPVGSLWPLKFTDKAANDAMANIQWSQEPTPPKGVVFQSEWFNRYSQLPANIKAWSIYCDTASKPNKYNDYTVFQLWATTTDNHGYLVDQFRDKPQIPYLRDLLKRFSDDAKVIMPRWPRSDQVLKVSIEDKDSGTGLIQALKLLNEPVTAIQRTEGKAARAAKATPSVLHGKIFLPNGPVGDSIIAECIRFKPDDSHKHDDQIDPLVDYINFELPDLSTAAVFGRATGTHN